MFRSRATVCVHAVLEPELLPRGFWVWELPWFEGYGHVYFMQLYLKKLKVSDWAPSATRPWFGL